MTCYIKGGTVTFNAKKRNNELSGVVAAEKLQVPSRGGTNA